MLMQHAVVPYLLRRGLLGPRTVLGDDLVVSDVSRRNRNFAVVGTRGPCYLLKQGLGPEGRATVAHEAAVYRRLQSSTNPELGPYLPRFHDYDLAEQILVLEFFPDARDLREHQARCGRFSRLLAARLGTALGTLHRVTERPDNDSTGGELLSVLPWILYIHKPDPATIWGSSRANVQLIKVIQRFGEFAQCLDELRLAWRPESVIHFDLKFDNCIVLRRPTSRRRVALRLVDWELAGWGDPGWDVGSTFAHYLGFWALSVPDTGEGPKESSLALARYPLYRIQPAMQSFWRSYVREAGAEPETADQCLLRAVRYAAARLLQIGLEQMQTAAQLTGSAVSLLQLSLNILRRPGEAAVRLLGIPLERPARS